MITDEEFSNLNECASKTATNEFVRHAMEEYAQNMGFKLDGLPEYGLQKIVRYAAIVSAAIMAGIDPEELKDPS